MDLNLLAVLKAILIGAVEGFTEFLPVSSTAHIILSSKILKYNDPDLIFTVFIQMGAMIAILRRNFEIYLKMIPDFMKKPTKSSLTKLLITILFASLLAFGFDKLFGLQDALGVIFVGLLLGNVLMIYAEANKKKAEVLDNKKAALIGFSTALAFIPGVSRSGASISGGRLVGLDLKKAFEYSFLTGVPILVLASAYQLSKNFDKLNTMDGGYPALVFGFIAAFIFGEFAYRIISKKINPKTFQFFIKYRFILAFVLLVVWAL